ncbi:enoyl-CoA hydratase [Alteribacter natronophilus]|uniref:enoyl-CoA hydratase n=1 Tax=Alteribacter natronophilus TaxID=2583810 RepID=UPI00110E082A|nr:enoyl-CoA hydratase [Alteribacter natronophilus]TMW71649.1 enoyl-CoA hydratase [Alteribacter natronophilus]
MSEYSYISTKTENRIGYLTLQHSPANALCQPIFKEMNDALDQFENDDDVKVILVHGEGRFFAAGADIKEFTTVENGAEFQKMAENGQRVFDRIDAFPKPVIAAIHGAALGGGLELAMACHIRFAGEKTKLGLPELQLGLVPGFAGTQRLPKLVGRSKATQMLLTSEPVTGHEAQQIGLVDAVFEDEAVLGEAQALAEKVALKGAVAVRNALRLLHYADYGDGDGGKKEAESFGEVFETEDAKEGIDAFMNKRQPVFNDR